MRFLYCTDLHGCDYKYEAILKYALEHKINLIHLGADILPKGSDILGIQKYFTKNYLKNFYQRAKENGIDVLAFFGNDDLYSRKKYFKEYAQLLDEVAFEKEGYIFKAYGYVPDYKFGLKTACKLDYPGWTCPEKYIGKPVDFTDKGRVLIDDPVQYFLNKGTIKEDLNKISVDYKTIMAIHCPPRFMGMDVCYDKQEVGSKSVFDFIATKRPLLALFGHIHESPEVTGIWDDKIGKTWVLQPGQRQFFTTIVDIEIKDSWVNAKLIQI